MIFLWRSYKEDQSHKLNFLDVTIISTGVGKYVFKMHRKNATSNAQIKSHSYVNPALIRGVFERFLSRVKKSCSEKYLDEELSFLVDMSVESGYDQNHLYSMIWENKRQAPKT